MFPRTYHNRLLVYTGLLVAFLLGVLVFSYGSSRSVIIDQASQNVNRAARQIEFHLVAEASALGQRVQMIGSNMEVIKYMSGVTDVTTNTQPLRELIDQQFEWLPHTKVVVVSYKGRELYGDKHTKLAEEIKNRNNMNNADNIFYYYQNDIIEVVAVAPIFYRNKYLGAVAVSKPLDRAWMTDIATHSDGHLILVSDEKILHFTKRQALAGSRFSHIEGQLVLNNEPFMVQMIEVEKRMDNVPQIWLGLSESRLMADLQSNKNAILILSIVGSLAILITGLMILKNFSKPMWELINSVRDIEKGQFPDIVETEANSEMDVLRNHFSRMVRSLKEKQATISEIHEKLEHQATTDELTGLYNRRHLYDLFPKLLSESDRQKTGLVVILCDLDKFKAINDQLGHFGGDECLRHFAKILKACSRASDFIFRMGGEEFLLVSSGTLEGGMVLAEKIRRKLEATPVSYDGSTIAMTVSIGVAFAEKELGNGSLSKIVGEADLALYRAKDDGRNCVCLAGAVH